MTQSNNTITLLKDVQLKYKIGKSENCKKADDLRNVLVQLQNCRASNIIDAHTASSLYLKDSEKYAELIDSPEAQGGLDNYAGSILKLVQGRRNESSQWRSSLSLSNIEQNHVYKSYQKTCKAAKATVVPDGKVNEKLPFFVKSKTPSDSISIGTKNSSNLSADKGNKTYVENSLSNNKENTLNKTINSGLNQYAINNIQNQLSNPSIACDKKQFQNNVGLFNTGHASASSNNSADFWNAGESSTSRQNSSLESSRTGFGNFRGKDSSDRYFSKSKEQSLKRGRESDDNNDNDDQAGGSAGTVGTSLFRTARQQLAIDNQKKNRGRNPGGQGQVNTSAYGTSKKSLGTRRGLNSKFVPPVMNREDSDGGSLVQRAGPNRGFHSGEGEEEEVDERLKNIDPKMVELIRSEIMDQGHLLTWDDIAGLDFAKKTIQEIVVWPMLRPDIFTGLRGPPKGLLLFGPPGTGKTLIGKCIASQSKSTFFSISASSLTSKWIGDGEKMVRALFAVARVHQPAVVFIDEIDSLLSQRSDTEHESSRRIKTEFLVQLDGTTTGETDRVLVVGATNRPQEIDEAARRRFVKRLYIPLPEGVARRQIIHNLMSEQRHHLQDTELRALTEKTDGYSGADMANLCREAALGPIRSIPLSDIENITAEQVRPIVYGDFEDALKQVRASVSDKDLDLYLDWNKQYGSWGM